MTASCYSPEYASSVLVDAMVLGDKAAARKWGISSRTVERYRARMKTDKELSALVAEKNDSASHDLSVLRVAFLRDALQALRDKLPDGSLYEVAGAVKIVGELHQTAMMVGDERPDEPDAGAAEDEGGGRLLPPGSDEAARH